MQKYYPGLKWNENMCMLIVAFFQKIFLDETDDVGFHGNTVIFASKARIDLITS